MIGRRRAPGQELTAALRVTDQAAGRSPVACVKTGVPTDRATRVRATALRHATRWEGLVGPTGAVLAARVLRRPTATVVLNVSEAAWRRWRRRLRPAVSVGAAAVGTLGAGLVQGDGVLAVLALVLLGVAGLLRARAWRACWVGLQLRPGAGDVVVSRVHPAFADQARRLWVASL